MEFEDGKTKSSSIRTHLMQQVAEQSDMCDVTIKLGNWEKRFHWCVLTASPFFDALYKGNFMERHNGVVKMQIGTPSTVAAALLFLYGKRPKVTDDNVGQLLQLAEFLLISNLKRHCFQWLNSRNVNSKNCIDICEMCSLYEFEIESCSQYVLAHLTELFNDDNMLKITNDTLTYILQDETLSYASTEERFDFIIKWVAYSPGRQPYFEQLFNLVDPTGFSEEFLESRVLCSPFVNSSTTCMEKLANCQGSSTGDQLTDVLVPYPPTYTYMHSRDRVIECLDPIEHKWYQLPSQPGAVKAFTSASVYDNSTIYALNAYDNKLQIINIDKEMHVECKEKKLQYADNTVDLPRINVKHVVVVADKCFLVSSFQPELIKSTTNKEHNVAEYVDDPTKLDEFVKLRLPGVDPMLARQLLVNQISNTRCVYVDTTTVYSQSGEDDENMYIHPFFTVKYDVHAVCSSTNGGICLLGDGQVSVFNTVTNILDTIDTHSFSLNEGNPTLSPTSNGFMVHSGPDAIQVTPIQGPALVDRWKLRKIRIDSSEEKFNNCSYYLVNNAWYRNSRISYAEDYSFSAKSDADIANFCQTQEWKPLPLPKRYKSNAMPTGLLHLRVPRRIVRCHLDCPHCEYKRSTLRSTAHDEDDGDDDDDDYDDDYYDYYYNDYSSPDDYLYSI